jgi:hypothetical protein
MVAVEDPLAGLYCCIISSPSESIKDKGFKFPIFILECSVLSKA